jgi:exosome complex protein LRP1
MQYKAFHNISVYVLAYTINALLYVHLKSHGVSSKDIRQTHVKQELDRVKAFVKKIKDTEDKAKAKGPTLTLDKEASKRFVHNALSSDQVYVEALERKQEREQEQEKKEETTPSKQKNCPNTGEKGSNSKRQRKK